MVRTGAVKKATFDVLEASVGRGHGHATRANAPPSLPPRPPISLEQLLATQYDLMRLLMENETRRGADQQLPRLLDKDSSYSDFLVTQPPIFDKVMDPVEADHWLCTTESKFSLLHYTEYQKTLYAAQQLRGSARA
jgi:hypothetical protein